jgi:hypothetical protein
MGCGIETNANGEQSRQRQRKYAKVPAAERILLGDLDTRPADGFLKIVCKGDAA